MYIFNLDQLKPFDILLIRFEGNETSEQIQSICNSRYSHAVIYIGDGSFIEGVEPVVTLFSVHRYYFSNLDAVKVLRLKKEFENLLDIKKAEASIRALANCNYSLRLLYKIDKRMLDPTIIKRFLSTLNWTGGIVCSSLVTLPYYAGGIDISEKDEPFYAHFGHIERSLLFEDVTNSVFDQYTGSIPEGAYDYLATVPTGSILEKQAKAVHEINRFVAGLFHDLKRDRENFPEIRIEDDDFLFTTWEDIFPYLMRWSKTAKGREIDELVYQKIMASGYDKLWLEEVYNQHHLFFPFFYLSQNINAPNTGFQPAEHYSRTAQSFVKYLAKLRHDEKSTFDNFSRCPIKTFHLLLDMYRSYADLIQSTITQYKEISKIMSKM